jgi:hypothetical protein
LIGDFEYEVEWSEYFVCDTVFTQCYEHGL